METKDVLKTLRKSNGFTTMQDFCKASGISFSTYQNYETGKRIPTADMLIKLADFYGVTTDYLLGRPDAEPPEDPLQTLAKQKNLDTLEQAIFERYMQLPQNIRKEVQKFMRQVANDAAKRNAAAEQQEAPDYITVSTTLGELEDRMKADEDANFKDGA